MSTLDTVFARYRYSFASLKIAKQIMSTNKHCDVIPLFPEKDEDSATTGWDPYIFSILADRQKSFVEERRRVPRPLTAARRRALLISGSHNAKKKDKR
jgi:hypothetical protein